MDLKRIKSQILREYRMNIISVKTFIYIPVPSGVSLYSVCNYDSGGRTALRKIDLSFVLFSLRTTSTTESLLT